ncbi:hypothetical protein LUZ60_009959 [Juncus effusus]|nr:hypothetical protein LUZ60_009959 [Juncus effusus]
MEPSSSSSSSHHVDSSRLPDSSLQRHSVSSLFAKLRLSPSPSSVTDAISLSLNSSSLAVADQTTRELCRLVSTSVVSPATALLELQSALDGCSTGGNARLSLAQVFVKAIGFVVRFLFRADPSWGRSGFEPVELHPFIKVLLCGEFVEMELIRQVSLFTVHNKESEIESVARFLKPLLIFSILRKNSSNFAMDLISSLASISCSLKVEAISILKLLTGSLKYFPHENRKDIKLILSSAEYILDAYIVVLKQQSVFSEMLESNTQECSWALLETIFSLCFIQNKSFGINETVFQLAKRLLSIQKEINLKFLPEFNSIFITISYILSQTDFEHEQLAALKLLIFLTDWKHQTGLNKSGRLREELFCVFSVVALLMSPSKSVKAMASNFLLRINEFIVDLLRFSPSDENLGFNWTPPVGTHASVLFRLLHLWFEGKLDSSSCFYMEFIVANDITEPKRNSHEEKSWPFLLRNYFLNLPNKGIIQPGISGLINSVISVLILHPTLGKSSVETLAGLVAVDQKSAMPLLLITLFYIKILSSNESNKPELLLKLMESLSFFSAHNFMVPVVVQTVLPILKFESKPDLYSIAVRLLCKIWITTDRVFAILQEVLDPKAISEFISEREISISIAASIRDVCKHNPDRGVDIILSVSSCIESRDKIVQALGLEGLTFLCEADVVDFYTAWIVIKKHLLDYSLDPIIAHGVARLLRWGAMDAEAYPDASRSVLQIMWNIASKRNIPSESSSSHWTKARVAAFTSLSHYKVVVIQEAVDEFKKGNFELLISEENSEVLNAMEELQVEIIKYEHTTRRRGQKDARITASKTEKLLDVFPQAIFSRDKIKYQDLPGAALICFNFTPKLESPLKSIKDLQKVNQAYEKALMDLAESLHITRNLIFAIISIQSWKSFLDRWIEAVINFMKDSSSSDSLDKHTRAAKDILKILCRIAEESIPRVAVNIALAIGALCLVVPDSAHFVVSDVSDFLLKWLFEFEHEHKQWTAAICLGFIADCFHPTDQKTKFKVINALHEVICKSESDFVRGACGAGLGFASKSLFKSSQEINSTSKSEETKLLETILTTLSALISKQCPSTSNSLNSLTNQVHSKNKVLLEAPEISDEDPWGTAGLVLGLGNSVFALYRSGSHDSVITIKNLLMKWIEDKVFDEMSDIKLLMGSCLALPIVISFSQRVDLSTNDDLDLLLESYNSLICEIINVNKSGVIYSDLLMAACVGAGQLISSVLNDGVYDLKLDGVTSLLETIKSVYDNKNSNYSYSVYLGGLFGVVNAFGASAGYINLQKEKTSIIKGPLLSDPTFESIIQEMFVLAKESKDLQRRQFCAWALAFLRNQFLKETSDKNSSLNQNLSEETLVWDLSSYLRDFDSNKEVINAKKGIISTMLSCLSKSPKLPSFDWGIIIRRFMKHQDISINKECLNFSLIHANHISPLLNLLDDLTDLPRFKTLDLNLQLFLLESMSQLLRLFSESRLEKLCVDLVQFFSLERNENSILRRSLWKGLCGSLRENYDEIVSHLEKLMEFMLIQLPNLNGDYLRDEFSENENEWFDVIECLDLASKTWLLNYLKIGELDQAKKIVIISRLVRHKSLHISELAKIRAYILDAKDEDIWLRVLLEVSSTISNSQVNIKQQWLLDALDISCVSHHPSTALKFVGLLSGFCSELMPVLIVNQTTVLLDLPITLSSLLSDPNWSSVRVTIAEKVWSIANRVRSLAEHLMPGPGLEEKEAELVFYLASVMHQTCVLLKEYLSFDKQIKLANLDVL